MFAKRYGGSRGFGHGSSWSTGSWGSARKATGSNTATRFGSGSTSSSGDPWMESQGSSKQQPPTQVTPSKKPVSSVITELANGFLQVPTSVPSVNNLNNSPSDSASTLKPSISETRPAIPPSTSDISSILIDTTILTASLTPMSLPTFLTGSIPTETTAPVVGSSSSSTPAVTPSPKPSRPLSLAAQGVSTPASSPSSSSSSSTSNQNPANTQTGNSLANSVPTSVNSGINTSTIIGIAIGGMAAVIIIACIAFWCLRRRYRYGYLRPRKQPSSERLTFSPVSMRESYRPDPSTLFGRKTSLSTILEQETRPNSSLVLDGRNRPFDSIPEPPAIPARSLARPGFYEEAISAPETVEEQPASIDQRLMKTISSYFDPSLAKKDPTMSTSQHPAYLTNTSRSSVWTTDTLAEEQSIYDSANQAIKKTQSYAAPSVRVASSIYSSPPEGEPTDNNYPPVPRIPSQIYQQVHNPSPRNLSPKPSPPSMIPLASPNGKNNSFLPSPANPVIPPLYRTLDPHPGSRLSIPTSQPSSDPESARSSAHLTPRFQPASGAWRDSVWSASAGRETELPQQQAPEQRQESGWYSGRWSAIRGIGKGAWPLR